MSFVQEHMTSPVVTVPPDWPIPEVIALLRTRAISAAPVVEAQRLVGIVSTTDLLSAGPSERVRDRMTTPVVTARPADELTDAARRLVAARVHRLVVVDAEARIAGVLSARDVASAMKQRGGEVPLRRVMSADLASVEVGDPIVLAVERLRSARVHGLVVMDGGVPVGVFTHAEALAARRLPPSLLQGPVEDVMSYENLCLHASTPVRRAVGYVVAMNVRRILVVEGRKLVGIASVVDLVDALSGAT